MQFRNMLTQWLKRKIFAPISEIRGYYNREGGKNKLIVPDIDWNHMSLFDTDVYIQNLITLTAGQGEEKRASLHTLYRSLGLEYEDEIRKIRKENIQNEINKKEKEALASMSLNELRSLNEDDEIPEPQEIEETVPGENSGGSSGGGGGSDSGLEPPSGMPDLSVPEIK